MSILQKLFGREREHPGEKELIETALEFIQVDDLAELRHIAEQHPELLTDRADAVMEHLAQIQTDESLRQEVVYHRALLRRCRELGMEGAFAEQAAFVDQASLLEHVLVFMRADDWTECLRIAGQHPDLLTPDAEAMLVNWLRFQMGDDSRDLIEESRALLQSCREVMQATEALQAAIPDGDLDLSPDRLGPLAEMLALSPEQQDTLYEILEHTADPRSLNLARDAHPDLAPALDAILADVQSYGSTVPPQLADDLSRAQEAEERYRRTADLSHLQVAISTWRSILDHPRFAAAPDHFKQGALNDGGAVFMNAYDAWGRMDDLDRAIGCWQAALEYAPPGDMDQHAHLGNLGAGLRQRYLHSGSMEDLDQAIELSRQSLECTPSDSPNLSYGLGNLVAALNTRFSRTGRLQDLEEAIQTQRQAVEITPSDSPDLAGQLNNLAIVLSQHYRRSGNLQDLKDAIAASRQAVEHTPPDWPESSTFRAALGAELHLAFSHSGQMHYLEESIEAFQQTLEQTPPESPARSAHLDALGSGLLARFDRAGQSRDLEEAIAAFHRAIKSTSPDSPGLPGYLLNLGTGLRARYAGTGHPEDLEEAQTVFRRACERGLEVNLGTALTSARSWGDWAFEREDWLEAIQAYGYGSRAIAQLLSAQLVRSSKESWLREAQGLSTRAAYALARAGDLEGSVVTLEGGCARLLGEALERTRSDLERLPALGHADLYERYRQAAEQVQALSLQTQQTTQLSSGGPQLSEAHLRQAMETAQAELADAIADIQKLEGYQDFFESPTLDLIRRAATRETPLIYLTTTPAGSVALIVHPGSVESVWLNSLTDEALRKALTGTADDRATDGYLSAYLRQRDHPLDGDVRRAWNIALHQVTRWLWDVLMGPLTAHLKSLELDRAILIPTGLLGLLPQHAAWTEQDGAPSRRRYALDEVTFTYAPSARALVVAQAVAARTRLDSLLVVDNPDGSLVFSRQEAEAVLACFPTSQRESLTGDAATRQAVIERLSSYSVLHFSTHGWAVWDAPLESGLLLGGGSRLTLQDFLNLRLGEAGLVVLSACETGIPGTELPDEVVSLPTGLIQAGAARIIASLWAVDALSTALLMGEFYRRLLADGQVPAEALRGAQRWLRDATADEMKLAEHYQQLYRASKRQDVGALRLMRHYQAKPEAKPFAHPYYWAPFVFYGYHLFGEKHTRSEVEVPAEFWDRAREVIEKLKQRADGAVDARNIGDVLRSATQLEEVETLSDDDLESIYATGYEFFTSGDYELAKEVFDGLTAYAPYTAHYWRALSATYQQLKDYPEAIAAYDIAIAIDEADVVSYVYRGESQILSGNVQDGLRDLEYAQMIGARYPEYDAWVKRSQMLLEMHKPPEP